MSHLARPRFLGTDEVVGPVLHKVCPVTCGVCELAAADMFDEDIYLGLVDAFEDAQVSLSITISSPESPHPIPWGTCPSRTLVV